MDFFHPRTKSLILNYQSDSCDHLNKNLKLSRARVLKYYRVSSTYLHYQVIYLKLRKYRLLQNMITFCGKITQLLFVWNDNELFINIIYNSLDYNTISTEFDF